MTVKGQTARGPGNGRSRRNLAIGGCVWNRLEFLRGSGSGSLPGLWPGGWACATVSLPGKARGGRRGGDGGHGVARLPPESDDGGAGGVAVRSKLSTMIMRPPQQGHGGRYSVAARCASSCSAGVSIGGSGAAISSLARAMLALHV